MITLLMGKKVGMSQVISETGKVVPVTYVKFGDNEVIQIKTQDKDGYNAVVLGANPYSKQTKNRRFQDINECRVDSVDGIQVGDKFNVGVFVDNKKLTITGFSKGKGFAGQVRKWNRVTTRKTHGTKYLRHGTTMNCCITGRSRKGLKMAGRMGNDRVTLKNRDIPVIDIENNVIAVKGALPGCSNGLIIIKKEK